MGLEEPDLKTSFASFSLHNFAFFLHTKHRDAIVQLTIVGSRVSFPARQFKGGCKGTGPAAAMFQTALISFFLNDSFGQSCLDHPYAEKNTK